ncbi:hypothetical protein BGZ81_002737, partial [Podila clonocystis]
PHTVINSIVADVVAPEDMDNDSGDETDGDSGAEGSGLDGKDAPLTQKKPYRGLQYQANGANQRNILFVAHFLKLRLRSVWNQCHGKTVPNLGKMGTLFKTLATELGQLEPLMAAVTGSILSSLFDCLIKESTNLQQFLDVASGIQWQETMIQNQANELNSLYKEMELKKAKQATEKAQKVQEAEKETQDIILASMQPRRQQGPSPQSVPQDMAEHSPSEVAPTSSGAITIQKEPQPTRSVSKRNDSSQKQVVYQEWEEKVWDGFSLLKRETETTIHKFSSKLDTQDHQINWINHVIGDMGRQIQGLTQSIRQLVQVIEGLQDESAQTQHKLSNIEDEVETVGKKVKNLRNDEINLA